MNDIRIRDSFKYAKEQGFDIEFIENHGPNNYHPNTVKITIESEGGFKFEVLGESIGCGSARIRMIDDIEVRIIGEYNTLLIKHYDRLGVLAHITSMIDAYGINITFVRLYRETKGEKAYTIIETDDSLSFDIINAINMNSDIISVLKFDINSL